jgi:hypothetical protein
MPARAAAPTARRPAGARTAASAAKMMIVARE